MKVFCTGFTIGGVLGFLGYFMQLEPNSVPFTEALWDALTFSLVLGLFIGFGFSARAGSTHAHATRQTDEADYSGYIKKHPPTTEVQKNRNITK